MCKSVSQSVSQSVNVSFSQSLSVSVAQSVNVSVSQSVTWSVDLSFNVSVSRSFKNNLRRIRFKRFSRNVFFSLIYSNFPIWNNNYSSGIAEFAKEGAGRNLGAPKVHLSFTLDGSGIVTLSKAEVCLILFYFTLYGNILSSVTFFFYRLIKCLLFFMSIYLFVCLFVCLLLYLFVHSLIE